MYAELLHERYPEIDVDPRVLDVADDRVMTSAGTGAGVDLCLHIVACDHRADVAAAVARRAALSPRTLTRRFRAATGVPHGEWLQRARLRLAQRLLESTDEPDRVRRPPRRLRVERDDAGAVRDASRNFAPFLPANVSRTAATQVTSESVARVEIFYCPV